MRTLLELINESIEDGKYLDLPTEMYKPYNYSMPNPKPRQEGMYSVGRGKKEKFRISDEQYAKRLAEWEERNEKRKVETKKQNDEWKRYVDSVKKVNEENFDILIDKMLRLIDNKERRDGFIKNMVGRIIEGIKNNPQPEGRKDFYESRLIRALNSFRKSIALDNDSKIKGSSDWIDSYEENIYDNLYFWGSQYQIELPKFSKLPEAKHNLFTKTAGRLMDEFVGSSGRSLSDKAYSKKYAQFKAQVEKDKTKITKFRTAWSKTDQYKNLIKIADMIEDDVETIEKTCDRAYTRFDELNGKNKKYEEARKAVLDTVDEYIDKEFGNKKHAVRCWGKSLVDILVMIKLAGKEDPEIEIIDKNTSGWISGMIHSCKFKVTDEDGNEYVTGKYEDQGFDSYGDGGADGFGAWD